MSIEFNIDQPQFKMKNGLDQHKPFGMVGWFVKRGIVKDEASAKNILLMFIAFNLILTAFVIYKFIL